MIQLIIQYIKKTGLEKPEKKIILKSGFANTADQSVLILPLNRGEKRQLLPADCVVSLKLTHLHLTVSQTVPLALLLPPAT